MPIITIYLSYLLFYCTDYFIKYTMANKFEAKMKPSVSHSLKTSDESGEDETGTVKDTKRRSDKVQKKVIVVLVPLDIPPGEHRLQFPYALWFSRRTPGKQQLSSTQSYDQTLKLVGRFATVEQFWALYSHLMRPSELQGHSDYHIFKDGIKPMWEDEANQRGGKWIVRLRKGIVSRCWENLILAMLGEQFMVGEEVCGAVVSIRFQTVSSTCNNTSPSLTPCRVWKGAPPLRVP
ncbi:hypothetical protein B566_EDAN015082 [Ephemera danica]|nr:hypothetical protein B566_EDAN015082 [Ephemera danica]